jgi:hypothetical protein
VETPIKKHKKTKEEMRTLRAPAVVLSKLREDENWAKKTKKELTENWLQETNDRIKELDPEIDGLGKLLLGLDIRKVT